MTGYLNGLRENMKHHNRFTRHQFAIAGICLVFGALLLNTSGCNKGRNLREEIEARYVLKKAMDGYKSKNWTKRLESVEMLNIYLLQLDKTLLRDLQTTSGKRIPFGRFLVRASGDSHISVRIEALKGMAVILNEKAFKRINEMALHDRSDNVRWYAVQTLSLYKDTRAAPVFIKSLEDDDWLIREAAIKGILMLDEGYQEKNLVHVIVKAIGDPNNRVREAALLGVTIKKKEIYNAILQLFKRRSEFSNSLIIAIMTALKGYILDENIKQEIIEMLSHKNRQVRVLALRVLKQDRALKKLQSKKSSIKKAGP